MRQGGEFLGGLLCGFPFVVLWAYVMFTGWSFYQRKVPQALDLWVKENGYRLIHKEQRGIRTGPFFGKVGQRVVYRVHVQDHAGDFRDGWVCIGGGTWFRDVQIEEEWDRPRPPPVPDDQQPTRGNPLMWDRELDA